MGLMRYDLTLYPVTSQTPLEEEEREGLRIKNIATQGELNEFEKQNIEAALLWLVRKKLSASQILTVEFIKDLHYRMFKDVWRWAGQFRVSNKNLGVDKHIITIEIKKLLDDCTYWIDKKTFNNEEIAIRLKHRLVYIHPFINGNGRHSRLITDVMMEKVFQESAFRWGSDDMIKGDEIRGQYLAALRKADAGDYQDLIIFAKS